MSYVLLLFRSRLHQQTAGRRARLLEARIVSSSASLSRANTSQLSLEQRNRERERSRVVYLVFTRPWGPLWRAVKRRMTVICGVGTCRTGGIGVPYVAARRKQYLAGAKCSRDRTGCGRSWRRWLNHQKKSCYICIMPLEQILVVREETWVSVLALNAKVSIEDRYKT